MQKAAMRTATHAGTWYDGNGTSLNAELTGNLKNTQVTQPEGSKLKALIGPHAGLRFSGPNAAWAYRNLAETASQFDRVVLMGPSHKVYLDFIGTTVAS